jgi:hypothetical protein
MKRRRHASCICDDFENDNARRTNRASRWRKVRFHRSTCAVWPDSFPTAECRSLDATLDAVSRQRVPEGVEWRVLVVNNNCTDQTHEVLEKHLSAGRIPLRAVVETRQGLTHARVCGV